MNETETVGTAVAWGPCSRVALARPSLAMTNAGHAETRRTVGLASSAARVAGLALVARSRVVTLPVELAPAAADVSRSALAPRPAPAPLLATRALTVS